MKNKEFSVDIEKLKSVQGQELSYKGLCEALDLPIKTSNSKTSQLQSLQSYCDIIVRQKPTKYIITEVYEGALPIIEELNQNNKFQLLFDAALYQLFILNKCQPIYASSIDLLKLFKEVNSNFSYACNSSHMRAMGEEYLYMADMSQIVFRILSQWTNRRIKQMAQRKIVTVADGFRLYRIAHINDSKGDLIYSYKEGVNVPFNSELHHQCQTLYSMAIEKVLGPDRGKDIGWLSMGQWQLLKYEINSLVREKFNDTYCGLKAVKILCPPEEEWLRAKLIQTYQQLDVPAFEKINQEATRKILETKQLASYSLEEKNKYINLNVNPRPEFAFKDKLFQKEKRERD